MYSCFVTSCLILPVPVLCVLCSVLGPLVLLLRFCSPVFHFPQLYNGSLITSCVFHFLLAGAQLCFEFFCAFQWWISLFWVQPLSLESCTVVSHGVINHHECVESFQLLHHKAEVISQKPLYRLLWDRFEKMYVVIGRYYVKCPQICGPIMVTCCRTIRASTQASFGHAPFARHRPRGFNIRCNITNIGS